MRFINKAFIITILWVSCALGKDFGIQNKSFDIIEENILEALKSTITKIDIEKFQNKLREEAIKSINRPKGSFLFRVIENQTFIFDPSLILSSDLKDHTGKVFAFRGQKVNP